ncbi:hypothetical protein JK203_11520 [Gluconobacter cerinus]|uniref:hypothetical protein n=1 Tax=Gluconobacter cerinus TaxID=38307 RepID=UPI001B8BCA3D|nr:hypothetical protein [Gluconobacter cerinus]MBS1041467.1 hypothetical protein [Gluconobacter cerinus]MBS1048055.1 hypothetical protein [Gluconobacter cerinus]
MSTANLAILGVMLLVGVASALGLYKAGGNSQKAVTADQDVKDAQSQVAQQQHMEQRGADAPQTVDELLNALDKGQA